MDTLFIVRDSVITCAGKTASCCQHCDESVLSSLAWPFVVALGLLLAFALLWLYKPKSKKEQESKPDDQVTDSKEERIGKMQDMLYKHLQSRVYIEKVDKDGHKYKEYNQANDEKYINALENAINELKTKVTNDSKETQDSASQIR